MTGALCAGMAAGAGGQRGSAVPIRQLTGEDVARIDLHDGSVADWLEVLGEPTLTGRDDLIPAPPSDTYDPLDLDVRIWLAWLAFPARIYCALERVDDVYINDFDRGLRRGNNWPFHGYDSTITLIVDGDRSGGLIIDPTASRQRELDNVQAQFYWAIGPTHDDGHHVDLFENGFTYKGSYWFLRPPWADGGGGAFGEAPTVSVTEFYVTPFDHFVWDDPLASRVSQLQPGAIIGLHVVIPDFDRAGRLPIDRRPDGGLMLSSSWLGSDATSNLPDAILLPPGQRLGTASEVAEAPARSWARVKTSLGARRP